MSTPPDHLFPIPSLSDTEMTRLKALADACCGRHSRDGHYHFSPVRGQKFELLWRTGWSHAGHWSYNNGNKDRRTYRHPLVPGVHVQAAALRLARVMDRKAA